MGINELAFPTYTRLRNVSDYREVFDRDVRLYGSVDVRVEQFNFNRLEKANYGGLVASEEWLKKYEEPRDFVGGSEETRNDLISMDPIEGSHNAERGDLNYGAGVSYIKNGRLLVEKDVDPKDRKSMEISIVYTMFYQPNQRLVEAYGESVSSDTAYGLKQLSVIDNPLNKSSVNYNWWQRDAERDRSGFMQKALEELGRTNEIRTFSDWIDLLAIPTGETALTCFTFDQADLHDMLAVHIVQNAGGVVYDGHGEPINLLNHVKDRTLYYDLIAAANDDIAQEVLKKKKRV
jgi:fructose-1,6-bisphosphatase/inositol monophosphatase family enzyme